MYAGGDMHMQRDGWDPTIAASFLVCSQGAGFCLYELWECTSSDRVAHMLRWG